MKYPTRIYYTETDKTMMWDRWQKGESLHSRARHFGRSHSSIHGVPARNFWSVTAYDLESASYIRDTPKSSVDSNQAALQQNSDGSFELNDIEHVDQEDRERRSNAA